MYEIMQPDTVESRRDLSDELLRRYSSGRIDRRLVMDRLDVSYSELLEMLHQRDLEMPAVDPQRRQEMADTINRLLDEAAC